MGKKDWAIIAGTLVYSFLFYDQGSGLNLFIFSIFLVALFAFLDKSLIRKKEWLLIASFTIVSGVFVFIYGSALSIFGNIICLLLLPGFSNNGKASVILNLFSGIYSVLGSVVFIILKIVNSPKNNESVKSSSVLKFIGILIPIVFILIFFFIYKSINPLFEKYTNFISGDWVMFTIGGLFITYGLIRQERIKSLDNWEGGLSLTILNDDNAHEKWNERTAIAVLFIALNLMLIFINVLDINYLYLGSGMPNGLTHKEFVHNGVGMLILSIILGICIILYFFRGSLNFSQQNKPFKILVYFWLFQNLMMVCSTLLRNKMYIDDALLTYKRIGVYYWLFMAALGLITTFIKVSKTKSNWYLIKHNSYIAFVILILSGSIDWDRFISTHNISHAKLMASLDKRYLISLSETNIAQLYEIKDRPGFNTDSLFHYNYYRRTLSNEALLDRKLYDHLNSIQTDGNDWRSYNIRKDRVTKEIYALSKSLQIKKLNLSSNYVKTLKPIYIFAHIKELNVGTCDPKVMSEISHFEKLETLSLYYLEEKQLNMLKVPPMLKVIKLSNTSTEMIEKLKAKVPDSVKVEVLADAEYY